MRDLTITYRRLGEIHDAVRAARPTEGAVRWSEATVTAKRVALLMLDLAQHYVDAHPFGQELDPAALLLATSGAAQSLGYQQGQLLPDGMVDLYLDFAEALIVEVLA